MENVLLEVKDLEVSFYNKKTETPAIRKISYTLHEGEVLGIVGESGSGKSVSSHCILQLTPENGKVKGGEILFQGKDITKMSRKEINELRGNQISMIFQDPMTSLDPLFTIGNQLEEALKKHTDLDKKDRQKRMVELLELVGINQPEKRLTQYPHEFSGGMRQRAMIAMALSCNPKLLIADEPTTALDVTIQAQIVDLLKELKKKLNMSIIFITHDLGVVSDICDKIIVMYAGEIIETGSKRQIFHENRHPYTEGLLKSIPKIEQSRDTDLIPIEGTPPDMQKLGPECPFAPRCEYAMRICSKMEPPKVELDGEHSVACWKCYRAELEKVEK
ncbi:MAG: ABC transporter ATP-binding protein [Lachnospiraceae bacterium]|nr:ABC transporter ATP-binding protein [Lachnospiraceae bacterium]